tara:strand:+ start:3082 stop:3219 length:138 start_codon:yes stop_codon:yes gene_type:complete
MQKFALQGAGIDSMTGGQKRENKHLRQPRIAPAIRHLMQARGDYC